MPKNQNSRILLPNGCSCTGTLGNTEKGIPHSLPVTPKNWKQTKKIAGPWRICYRFYDPSQPKPKQVPIKLMNDYKTVEQRKKATQQLIDDEIQMLLSGWNPFHKKVIAKREEKYDIEPSTLFIDALKKVLKRIKLEDEYYKHIESYIIPNIEKAALHLGYSLMLISEVKRKHIIFMLDYLREVNKRFSDNTFNRFRTDLKILFSELLNIEAIETNPVNDIKAIPLEDKTRQTLTKDERVYINQYLAEKHPDYHRLLNIFFHSGARGTELCRLQASDVDLQNQRFKRQIRKGKKYRTVWTPIKDIAMKYWIEQMSLVQNTTDYIFSSTLKPGSVKLNPKYFSKLWYRWIKKKFVATPGTKRTKGKFIDRIHMINGKQTVITADWYSLHHSNATEMVNILKNRTTDAEKKVAELKGHTSEAMVVKIYDVDHESREHKEIRKVNNPFA